jgi:peptidoglycan/LPS O-acetylase OafA/YrhL
VTGEASIAPAPRRTGELVSIQYLRGIAAMMVVVFHLQPQLVRMGYNGPWLPGLSSGVDIFFVISGFIMWVTTCGKPITPLDFWQRRISRIVPLYWLVTTFMVVVMLVAPRLLQTSRFDPAHVAASYLFVAWPHPAKHVLEPVVMPGWTLNYEMFFYLIFGIFLAAPPRWRFAGTVGSIALLVLAGGVAGFPNETLAQFYTSDIMLEFALGVGLGWISTNGGLLLRVPPSAGWAMLIVGLLVITLLPGWLDQPPPRVVMRGIPAAALAAGALIIETHRSIRSGGILKQLGDASYSIYLSHVVTMSAVSQGWRLIHLDRLPGGLILFCAVCVAICAVVGWLCYFYVERPLIHLFRHTKRDGAVARHAPPQSPG